MPSSVVAAMDQCLVEGATYIYQEMQTQKLQVTVISATRMNALQDSREHPLQGVDILLLQITKCLDFTHNHNQHRCHIITGSLFIMADNETLNLG